MSFASKVQVKKIFMPLSMKTDEVTNAKRSAIILYHN